MSDTKILAAYQEQPENWGDARVRLGVLRPEEPKPLTLETCSAEQRAAVVAIAGDDPAKQQATLASVAPSWGRTVQEPPRPEPKTPRETYERLKETNPIIAARFAEVHRIHE